MPSIGPEFIMKKLLVTGASGFLGWNICNLAKGEWDVYGTVLSHPLRIDGVTIVRTDLELFEDIRKLFLDVRPDAVVHTAAMSDPNQCQTNRDAARRINVDASLHIADLCAEHKIPYVFTSSDMVFEGLNAPYREDDPVCPINIYGEQKVMAEDGIRQRYPDAAICRMALIFGPASPVYDSFLQPMIRAMREGKELRLFTDEFRNPVSARASAEGLFTALHKVKGTVHLGGIERISRYDLGLLMKDVFGIPDAKLIPSLQKDVVMAAPRAPDVTLDSSRAYALGFRPLPLKEELQRLVGKV